MVKLGRTHPRLVGITAAMKEGTGLKKFENEFPDRLFDVGIAEEHAVSFAAGLALGGIIPVVAIYSSFLQRAVDQMLHDVCMQNLHVIFAIDRAGLVGADGETHQGCFDLSYMTMMPNMTVMAPKNQWELGTDAGIRCGHAEGPCRHPLSERKCMAGTGKSLPAPVRVWQERSPFPGKRHNDSFSRQYDSCL